MARGAVDALAAVGRTVAGGLVVSIEGSDSSSHGMPFLSGAHPVPDASSHEAAAALGLAAQEAQAGGSVVVLISGGTTSLVAAPVAGVGIEALRQLFELLHARDIDIAHANAIRKRFLRWGAGRLAMTLAPAPVLCFAISDVPDDDLATIGSGPCAPDRLVAADVAALLARLHAAVPAELHDYLARVVRGALPETPKPGDAEFSRVEAAVIASNRDARRAAQHHAARLGLQPLRIATGELLDGEAHAAGERIARTLIESRAAMPPNAPESGAAIWGGETVVALAHEADARAGGGGRCQELALAAARVLHDAGDAARGITLLAAGTDGRDGPTDAAGAVVDELTWSIAHRAGRDPQGDLAMHQSYRALDSAGALLRTGPSGTNVMDLVVGIVAGPRHADS